MRALEHELARNGALRPLRRFPLKERRRALDARFRLDDELHRGAPPCQKHHRLGRTHAFLDHVGGEYLPPELAVRIRRMLAHGERRVQKQHASARPRREVPARRDGATRVGRELFEDIAKTRRDLLPLGHRERKPHRLPRTMVRVLPKHDRAHVLGRGEGERV